MEIRIKINNNKILIISIERDIITSRSLYLINIITEYYDNDKNIIFAKHKGFIKRKNKKRRK